MFTAYYESWARGFLNHTRLKRIETDMARRKSPEQIVRAIKACTAQDLQAAEKAAKDLQVEMQEAAEDLKRAEEEAQVLLEIISICDERISFNESLISFIKANVDDIKICNQYIRDLLGNGRRSFKNKEELLIEFIPLCENDRNSYRNIKGICYQIFRSFIA